MAQFGILTLFRHVYAVILTYSRTTRSILVNKQRQQFKR